MTKKIDKPLSPEQLTYNNIEKLKLSEGWEYIVSQLNLDKEVLLIDLKKQSTKAATPEDLVNINYLWNKIELIEDMINMPKNIMNELTPVLDTDSPNM